MYCNIVLDQLEHIDVCREITSLHFLVIETKHSDKFLEDYVVFSHDLLADFSREAHHFHDDVFQFHVLYQH